MNKSLIRKRRSDDVIMRTVLYHQSIMITFSSRPNSASSIWACKPKRLEVLSLSLPTAYSFFPPIFASSGDLLILSRQN